MPRNPSPILLRPCHDCGTLSDQTRCPEHRRARRAPIERRRPKDDAAGYDAAWRRLSKRARKLQPFCLHCGSTSDLTTDHTPEAWERKRRGKKIRIKDVRVLCRSCNGKAGPARKAVRSY